jgi:hypothetical protein
MCDREDEKKLRYIKSKTIKSETICVKKLNIKDCIKLPVKNIATAPLSPNCNLSVDQKSGYLYYSDGNKWYLDQPVDAPVNINLTSEGNGDYQNLDTVFNLFSGTPSVTGTVNVKLQPGVYPINLSNINLGINQLNITGDEREVSGMSYVNGKRANMAGRPKFGEKLANTEILFTYPNIVTINVPDLDLTQLGLVPGDIININSGVSIYKDDRIPAPSIYKYTLESIQSNKLIVSEPLSSDVLNSYRDGAFSPSVTFVPNTSITLINITTNINGNNLNMKGVAVKYYIEEYNEEEFIRRVQFNLFLKSVVQNSLIFVNNFSPQNTNIINSTLGGYAGALFANTTIFSSDNNQTRGYFRAKGIYLLGVNYSFVIENCDIEINDSTIISTDTFLEADGTFGRIAFFDCGYLPVLNFPQEIPTAFSISNSSDVFYIGNVNCENVKTICEGTHSTISLWKINLKTSIIEEFSLYEANNYSRFFIDLDTYDFKIPIDPEKNTVFKATLFSQIEIQPNNGYATQPMFKNAYISTDNSIIESKDNIDDKWPGGIIEDKGGKVYFA